MRSWYQVQPEPTTLGISAIEIPHSTRSLIYRCYVFIVRPICGGIMSPHYFSISQAHDDLQQRIAAINTLGPMSCSYNAVFPWANHRKSRTNDLGLTAIEITHLTRFTLLLLLRIQRYMCRNHVTTCVHGNDSGRILN